MVTHPDIAKLMAAQRYERLRHEADIWRLFHRQGKTQPGAPVRTAYQVLCGFARYCIDWASSWRPSRPLGQHQVKSNL